MIYNGNLPNKKYQIIYADPPWSFTAWSNKAQRHVSKEYPTMTFKEINELPVAGITQDNAALFLWITLPNLPACLDTMKRWGFEYKTCAFNWIKTYPFSGKVFFGMGYYTRSNSELCLLGIKGKPLFRESHSISQILTSPVEKHSKKPDITRGKIVELFGDIPRIELFARQETPGWDCWGNELVADQPLLQAVNQ